MGKKYIFPIIILVQSLISCSSDSKYIFFKSEFRDQLREKIRKAQEEMKNEEKQRNNGDNVDPETNVKKSNMSEEMQKLFIYLQVSLPRNM